MSRHWLVISQSAVSCSDQLGNVFKKMATNPLLAARLKHIDLKKLQRNCAQLAVKKTAEKFGGTVQNTYDNSTAYGSASGEPPSGKCLGVIKVDDVQLGLFENEKGELRFFWNAYSQECHGRRLNELKTEFENEFRRIGLKAAAAAAAHRVTDEIRDEDEAKTEFICKRKVLS